MSFRLVAKKFFLTYPGQMPKEELHEFINRKLKQMCKVKIAHEHYKDGGMHTHVCVEC